MSKWITGVPPMGFLQVKEYSYLVEEDTEVDMKLTYLSQKFSSCIKRPHPTLATLKHRSKEEYYI